MQHYMCIIVRWQPVRADVVRELEWVGARLQLGLGRHARLRLPPAAPRTHAASSHQVQVSCVDGYNACMNIQVLKDAGPKGIVPGT